MNCLSVDQLGFERNDSLLFSSVNACWQNGNIVQLLGHNGCGKTTFMRILAGLLSPSSGSVMWNDTPPSAFSFRSSLLYLGHHVGVKQTLTPLENLQWYFGLHGRKLPVDRSSMLSAEVDEALCRQALAKVGLRVYAEVPCYQLSAGQQRRAALARLLISKAPIWILDEPFTAIDVHGVAMLEEQIEAHAEQGGIVILTSHQAWQSPSVIRFDLEQYTRFSRARI